jgi:glutamine synthetase
VAPVKIPAEDRNRTSPFPYGGHRFEFRAAGSSQNVSMINTVLCTTIAESFQMIADQMDEGKAAAEVAAEMLHESWDVLFNGNGYPTAGPIEAERRHLCRIDSGVEACKKLTDKKNKDLFSKMNVMKPDECEARATIMYNHYAGTVEIEAKCMVDMIQQHIIPSATKVNLTSQVTQLTAAVKKLEADLHAMEHKDTSYDKATAARVLRLETMVDIRKICDAVEALVPPSLWTLATYKELLFLDFNHGARAGMTL